MAQFIVKSFDIFPYVVDKHDNIWKITEKGHFLKMTPWEDGEDRRVNRYQIEELIKAGKLTQYSAKPKLFEKLNKRWANISFEWIHDGKRFSVDVVDKYHPNFYKAPEHKFPHFYKDLKGEKHIYYSSYRIVFYNGNIYWATPYHYWPQVQLYEFESPDKEPVIKLESYFRWAQGRYLRPIYSYSEGNYI